MEPVMSIISCVKKSKPVDRRKPLKSKILARDILGEHSSIKIVKKKTISISARPEVILKRNTELDKHLKNLRVILENSNATPIRCKGSKGYACAFCNNEYQEPLYLKKHTQESHTPNSRYLGTKRHLSNHIVKLDITNLKCNICEGSLKSIESTLEHLKSHGKDIATDIKNHMIPFRFEQESLLCAVCMNEFNNFKVLLEHMNGHYRNYICEICGEGFVNKRIMLTHGYRHQKGEFHCEFCSKIFDTRLKKRDHVKSTHVCNKRNRCGFCGEKFSDYAKKNEHTVKMHGVKPLVLKCQACDKTYDNQRALTAHTKSYHMMERRRNYK